MRHRPLARSATLAWVLGVALSGCGDKPAAPVADPFLRIEISGHAADKPWPATGFRLKADDGREVALLPAPGATGSSGPVVEGRGKPGRYRILAPDGWGVFGGTVDAVDLRPDVPPVKIGVGHFRSIYAWPPTGKSVSTIRCGRDGAVPTLIDAESVIAEDGTAALRVPEAEWNGVIRVWAVLGPTTFAESVAIVVEKSAEARKASRQPPGPSNASAMQSTWGRVTLLRA